MDIMNNNSSNSNSKCKPASELSSSGCLNLALAFLKVANEDFRLAIKQYLDNPDDKQTRDNYLNIRNEILGERFGKMTGLDGLDIVTNIEYEYGIYGGINDDVDSS